MAFAARDVDDFVHTARDAQLRDLRHAIKARMGTRGYAWLSQRTLLHYMMFRRWSQGLGLIDELIAGHEFYRVSARGRGRGKGRTLYFFGWVPENVIRRQLESNGMPLAAFHAAERCFADFRARVSFFRRINDAQGHRQASSTEEAGTRKDGACGPDRPFLAPRGSPPTAIPRHESTQAPRRDTALTRHADRLRQLRVEMEGRKHASSP